jgi:sugar lactone lactonase YvrE
MKIIRSFAFLFVAAGFTMASAQTYTFTTFAGDASYNDGSVDGTGSAARFFSPFDPIGIAVDGSGNVFVGENRTIRRITADGVVTTFKSWADISLGFKSIGFAPCVAADGSGNVFIAEQIDYIGEFGGTIFKATAGGIMTTLPGGFLYPRGIAVDGSGNVFVADANSITKITAAGVVTTVAGPTFDRSTYTPNPYSLAGSSDGIGSTARFFGPSGLAVDGSGNVFVADTGNHTIRKITAGGVVTTLAGTAGNRGNTDGTGSAARFNYPQSVAVDRSGNVFVADTENHTIRKITADGVVTTLANSTGTYGSEDGTGNVARFYYPTGVAVDGNGNLFVADWGNNTIRKGVVAASAPFTVSAPQSQHVGIGTAATLTVAAAGSGFTYQWKKGGIAIAGGTRDTYEIASAVAGDMGFYSVVVTGAAGTVESPVAILTVATGGTSRLSNFSTRGLVPFGGELTVGFVLRGSGEKSVLVRAVGPTLGSFGVSGALADPRLDIIPAGASAAMSSNNDWGGGAALAGSFASAGAFALPAASKDAAVLGTLSVAGYSARVTSSVASGSGLALTEVYDRDPVGAGTRFVNFSTLGFSGTGAQALTLGFVIDGAAPKRLLIRAVGPGLSSLGVAGVLADPRLSILPTGKMFTVTDNDNWNGDAELTSAVVAAGTFALPASSNDAAVVVRLPPGSYTATVSGIPYTTGRALVEIYDLDP